MEVLMIGVFFGVVTGVIGAVVGESKGHAGLGFILGFLFSILGIIIVAIMSESDSYKEEQKAEEARFQAEKKARADEKISDARELLGIDKQPDKTLETELAKLKVLKEDGILLEEEYLEARKSVISKYL